MSIVNLLIELRNDSASPIVLGNLSIAAGDFEFIWDTVDFEAGATDNFQEVLDNIAVFNENIGNSNLVMVVNGVDQTVNQAFEQFNDLKNAYATTRIKNDFAILRMEGESVYGLTGLGTDERPGLLSPDGYEKIQTIPEPPTCIGQIPYSVDGYVYQPAMPITTTAGWIVNDQGLLIVEIDEDH